ncbi:MAG: efflux RND transporter periplasmic adaptor subunit [Bacteroidetes bacterium]|nr:efflux RND transporter periplasmic adaptor subunit [Bacteroidota bacterium]MBS1541415.1 efflux RND transporter periplasmic adaptor subunit [Bacteroidota bacterium]
MKAEKSWILRVAGHLAVVLLSLALANCSSRHPKEDKTNGMTTDVVELKTGKLVATTRIPGELVSFRDVDLYAKVNSFVQKLFVDVGSDVKEGQLLALLEAPEIISQIHAAKSLVESQTAIYKASKANYDRLQETSQTPGTISQNDLDQALGKMKSDFSQLEAARASEREVMVMQSYLEVRAPFEGTISARNINAGAYVGPSGKGSTLPMFTLNEQKRLRLVVYIPEAITGYVNLNDSVVFSVKTYPIEKFVAKVNRKAGALDNRLRSQRIEMDVLNNKKKLLPGMIADVQISLATHANTWIVPASAVVNSTEKQFVIRVENKKAKWVDIKKGLASDNQIEIFGDLNEGDQLVINANEEVRDGIDVVNTKIVSRQKVN